MTPVRRAFQATIAAIVVLCAAGWPSAGAASAGAAPPQEAYKQLPLRRDKDDAGSSAWAVVAVLAGIGVVVVLLNAHRRRGGAGGLTPALSRWAARRSQPRRMAVIERLGLRAGCAVYLVRWDDQEVLLGCTSQTVSVLARRPAADHPPEVSC